jgi:trk system potassium uptake protein TrkH
MVHLLSLGKDPMRVFIASFVLLIVAGAGALYLPRATVSRNNITVIDALFTSTTAACVTGLTVKDIGRDFTLMGHIVILLLIQLGGLGIVLFGAVFAVLFGQAFSIRESVAMHDLLSASTLNRITQLVAFVFASTMAIEALGAVALVGMWPNDPSWAGSGPQQWFGSIFHSVSAFCNAGLGLFSDNLTGYRRSWQVYGVICPLIILGGLGFGVLYNLGDAVADRIRRAVKWVCRPECRFTLGPARSLSLQTKIAVSVSAILIVAGAVGILVLERYTVAAGTGVARSVPDAFFQSVTARTAGFNTVNIGALTESSKVVLILLMFIGGSPGGTAGGIKTVTLAVVVMAVMSTLHQRGEVQMFRRSIPPAFVSRALAVIMVYGVVLFLGVLGLTLSERDRGLPFLDLMFEATSAIGTVGLSTGITSALSASGKVIVILLMLVGRLGPLSLAAALTFDTRRARYTYPQEAIMVG